MVDGMLAVDSRTWGLEGGLLESPNRRTQHSLCFQKNGQTTSVLVSNLHYQARPGEWEPQAYGFRLRGGDHVADRHWFETRVSDSGIAIVERATGLGVRWIASGRPTVRGRRASLSGDGVAWTWNVGPRRLKLDGLVVAPLGAQTYNFQYQPLGGGSDFQIVNGVAVAPGIKVSRPVVIGANGQAYPTTGWRLVNGPRLAFDFDDTDLPPEAYPYNIDPTTILQPGAGGFDTDITTNSPDTNFDGNPDNRVGNHGAGDNASRFLIKFDVSSIPSSDIVSSAILSMYEQTAAGNGAGAIDLHRVLRDWVVDEVTWNDYITANGWTTAGGGSDGNDRVAGISTTLTLDGSSANAHVEWPTGSTVVTDVQGFVDGGLSNFGWIDESANELSGATNDSNNLRTSEHATAADRPKLTVIHAAGPDAFTSVLESIHRSQPVMTPAEMRAY